MLLVAGCTSVLDRPSLPAGADAAGTRATAATSVSITPVTPDGMVTGPGVTDTAITLGVLVDQNGDRGFGTGVRLWQQSVNTTGGLCGRAITLAVNGADGAAAEPSAAYRDVGASVLGLLVPALPAASAATDLSTSIAGDQTPTVTATGTSGQLGGSGPLVAGATVDILVINGLQHLLTAGVLAAGDTVGVLDDGSAAATNALSGARWWADGHGLRLDARDPGTDPSSWSGDRVVLAPVDAAAVGALVAGAPRDVAVLALPDGYDPGWPDDTARAAADRLYVAGPSPAYGSDYPAAVAVASLAAAAGTTDPGPRTLDGYAAGSTWGRLITEACAERDLTRRGIQQAASAIGPAPATSLFGASDLGLVVQSGLPATRSSSISVVDRAGPSGLRSLVGLDSAPGIADYTP